MHSPRDNKLRLYSYNCSPSQTLSFTDRALGALSKRSLPGLRSTLRHRILVNMSPRRTYRNIIPVSPPHKGINQCYHDSTHPVLTHLPPLPFYYSPLAYPTRDSSKKRLWLQLLLLLGEPLMGKGALVQGHSLNDLSLGVPCVVAHYQQQSEVCSLLRSAARWMLVTIDDDEQHISSIS